MSLLLVKRKACDTDEQGFKHQKRKSDHLNLHQRLIAIVQEIPRFPTVDSHHTKEQLATQSQSHWHLALINDRADAALDVGL
jgi:hypothetical protein